MFAFPTIHGALFVLAAVISLGVAYVNVGLGRFVFLGGVACQFSDGAVLPVPDQSGTGADDGHHLQHENESSAAYHEQFAVCAAVHGRL